jgi:hypothetical protein
MEREDGEERRGRRGEGRKDDEADAKKMKSINTATHHSQAACVLAASS